MYFVKSVNFKVTACSWPTGRIITCRVVRVTKITGPRSDDWIYWHFGYKLS
jgi:hypothetical protein